MQIQVKRDFDCGMVAGARLAGLSISMKGYEWEVSNGYNFLGLKLV